MGPGDSVDDIPRAITSDGTNVYLGTDALNVAGIAEADHVAKWDGSAWSALGSDNAGNGWFPTSASPQGMLTVSSRLFVIGQFQNAGGDPTADVVASFDGNAWHPVGSNGAGDGPLNAAGHALAAFGQNLYAGGNFTSAGGDPLAQFGASFPLSGIIPTPTPVATPTPPPPPQRHPLGREEPGARGDDLRPGDLQRGLYREGSREAQRPGRDQ